jgi:hypothetical protein
MSMADCWEKFSGNIEFQARGAVRNRITREVEFDTRNDVLRNGPSVFGDIAFAVLETVIRDDSIGYLPFWGRLDKFI